MKYLCQFAVIGAVSLVGEILHSVLPFPVPASVYGLCLMFLGLCSGLIRLSWIEETANFLLAVMPIFFIEPSVQLMTSFGIIKGNVIGLVSICLTSWLVVIVVTGRVAQWMIGRRQKKQNEEGRK